MFCYLSSMSSASFTRDITQISHLWQRNSVQSEDEWKTVFCMHIYTADTSHTGGTSLGKCEGLTSATCPKGLAVPVKQPQGGLLNTHFSVGSVSKIFCDCSLSLSSHTGDSGFSIFFFNLSLLKHLCETLKTYTSFLYFYDLVCSLSYYISVYILLAAFGCVNVCIYMLFDVLYWWSIQSFALSCDLSLCAVKIESQHCLSSEGEHAAWNMATLTHFIKMFFSGSWSVETSRWLKTTNPEILRILSVYAQASMSPHTLCMCSVIVICSLFFFLYSSSLLRLYTMQPAAPLWLFIMH